MARSLAVVDSLGCGVYICWLRLPVQKAIVVGALGRRIFPAGHYAYVGSAQNGLYHRLRRHSRQDKPLRWHIDYLRCQSELHAIMAVKATKAAECALAKAVAALPEASVIVAGFGASDCHCPTHLYYFADYPEGALKPENLLTGLHNVPLEELI